MSLNSLSALKLLILGYYMTINGELAEKRSYSYLSVGDIPIASPEVISFQQTLKVLLYRCKNWAQRGYVNFPRPRSNHTADLGFETRSDWCPAQSFLFFFFFLNRDRKKRVRMLMLSRRLKSKESNISCWMRPVYKNYRVQLPRQLWNASHGWSCVHLQGELLLSSSFLFSFF